MDFDGRRPLRTTVRRLAELGTHDELLAADGLFASLHRLQKV